MNLPVDILRHYNDGVPFAIFRHPGEKRIYVAAPGEAEFYVNMWGSSFSENIAVHTAASVSAPLEPWRESTTRENYIHSTSRLIGRLRMRGGKCVRMRALCGASSSIDINGVVSDMFDRYPDAFCHCYYTSETGLWLGATPELLLECDGRRVRTMALAGTRPAGSTGVWDRKNKVEQAYVTRFILDAFSSLGMVAHSGSDETLRYGSIEHICTRIEANLPSSIGVDNILDALSPTPAVAGVPRDIAMSEIAVCEDAPRRCYAGYVMHRDADGHIRAYVNLRCVHISPAAWCIYAGGGITADSDVCAEWEETAAKASALLEILDRHSIR